MSSKKFYLLTFVLISILTTQANTLAVLNNHVGTTYMFIPNENTVQYAYTDNGPDNFLIGEINLDENPTPEELIFKVDIDKYFSNKEDTDWLKDFPEFITLSENEFVGLVTLLGNDDAYGTDKTIFFHEKDGEQIFFF